MNRRELIVGAGVVAAASALPPMPRLPDLPNFVRFVMSTRTRLGRHILLFCCCDRDGADICYPAPGMVREVTAYGRQYAWLVATDAPPDDVAAFFDCECGPPEADQ